MDMSYTFRIGYSHSRNLYFRNHELKLKGSLNLFLKIAIDSDPILESWRRQLVYEFGIMEDEFFMSIDI